MQLFKPTSLLFFSLFVWVFFKMQMRLEYLYDGSIIYPVFTLILFVLSYIFGLRSLKQKKVKYIERNTKNKLVQIVFFLFLIGLIGVLFKIYIGFFKSQIFVSSNVFNQRLENMGKEMSGGLMGIIASVLYPFSFISFLIAIYNYKFFNKIFLIVVVLVGMYPFLETLFMGGRTTIALLGTVLVFTLFATVQRYSKIKMVYFKLGRSSIFKLPKVLLKRTVYIPLLLVSIVFVSYSVKVLDQRLTRFGYGAYTFEVWERKDYKWVVYDQDFKQEYFLSSKRDKAKLLGVHNLKHYFVHGVIEYIRLVNHLDKTTGYYYGEYQFNVFFKFFKALGLPLKSFTELNDIVKRKSVYQTFWGPFYMDFGLLGIIVMFFWGRFTKRTYIYAKQGYTQYLIFYAYLSTIIITSFFINFLLGSSSYFLFAFLITILLFKYWPKNLNRLKSANA